MTSVKLIVCYLVSSGVPDSCGCSYDATLIYQDWEEAMQDLRAAVNLGREVVIKRTLVKPIEYKAGGPADTDTIKRFRGELDQIAGCCGDC